MNGIFRYHIAQEVTSGRLALVYSKYQHSACKNELRPVSPLDPQYQPLVLLLPPTANSSFQSIAIGSRVVHYPHGIYLRIAIIWNDSCLALPTNRSVLYLYELSQETIFKSFASSEDSSINDIRHIQGRRIQSLPPGIGGNHPFSLISPIDSDACASSSAETLQAACSQSSLRNGPTDLASSNPHSLPLSGILLHNQKCFVWGQSRAKGTHQEIIFKAFDLTLDDRWRDKFFAPSTIFETSHCACALHDLEFHLVLPSLALPESFSKYQSNSSSPGFYAEKPPDNIGSIIETISPARQQALDRMNEWKLERVRGMRRAGFTECDIDDLWYSASWTSKGIARKPEGWKTAGESMVEDWEEGIPSPNIATQDLRVKRFRQAKEGPSRILRKREEDFKAIMGRD